ncbi:MAG: FHA domain-containing protein [Gemmatales bacterium]|nr:FHA domain-containing protein [Gemmatales bacterium]MDW8387685.1 FHA domain-containing protein [Gemmatales bacterium]
MATVTFQVIDGVDKGRVFRDLVTPVSIGREEGNTVRLNDERISRFHAKVQYDQGDLILTDLESTNGTRVNGNLVQIHRLRYGDCVALGRSVLLFGSNEQIASRMAALKASYGSPLPPLDPAATNLKQTIMAGCLDAPPGEEDLKFDLRDEVRVTSAGLFIGNREFPPLPRQLSPSQAARLAEILDFFHRALSQITDKVRANSDGTQVVLDFEQWQKVLQIEMLLARYHRAVTEPDSWEDSRLG